MAAKKKSAKKKSTKPKGTKKSVGKKKGASKGKKTTSKKSAPAATPTSEADRGYPSPAYGELKAAPQKTFIQKLKGVFGARN